MFTGCGTALVTPFQNDFSLDEAALRRLVRRQVDAGVHFLVPCGTTGESPTLTQNERRRVVEITLEEAHGKVPVVAGAGGYDTAEVARAAREYEAMGVSGILSVASNEIPAEMASLCNFALQNNFTAARAIHSHYLPLMEVNFVESNPIPVKAAMAKMGLLQAIWRLPLVAPGAGSLGRIHSVLETLNLIEKTYAAVGD